MPFGRSKPYVRSGLSFLRFSRLLGSLFLLYLDYWDFLDFEIFGIMQFLRFVWLFKLFEIFWIFSHRPPCGKKRGRGGVLGGIPFSMSYDFPLLIVMRV